MKTFALLLPPSTGRWLRFLAIMISTLALGSELGLFLLLFFNQYASNWHDLLFPLSGGGVALASLLAWFFSYPFEEYTAHASQTEKLSPLETTPKDAPGRKRPQPPRPPEPAPAALWRAYTLPREGKSPLLSQDKSLLLSQDKYHCFIDHERCRCAMADGVSDSFLPSKWADIVVKSFVDLSEDFNTPEKFTNWLTSCRQQWADWVDHDWLPRIQQQHGLVSGWQNERERGAGTTLVGCSFSALALSATGHTNILVNAIGDAVFFMVRPPATSGDQWSSTSFALDHPDDFGSTTSALPSAEVDARQTWKQLKRQVYTAYRGDYIFLTTDALAKWILGEIQQKRYPWAKLLSLTSYEAFCSFVYQERDKHTLELDDTTMMVVPIV